MTNTKKCPKCGIEKALNNYYTTSAGKLQGYCKPCLNDKAAYQRRGAKQFVESLPHSDRSIKDRAILWGITDDKNVESFLSKLVIEGDCILYKGAQINGYGQYSVKLPNGSSVQVRAHRFAYALHNKTLPFGIHGHGADALVLNHTCHTRDCVNPTHLEMITNAENVSTAKRKPKAGK